MSRWRYRLARWLVGNFVNLPSAEGVWIVMQNEGGRVQSIVAADKFRMKTGITPHRDLSKVYGDHASMERFGMLTRWGRFVGTVKYR